MKYRHINGTIFQKMLENGYRNLKNSEKGINAINVFPVSDGDTGTNMCLTLKIGLEKTTPNPNLGRYLKDFSSGILLGARGNSGTILSQLFRGFYEELARCSIANAKEVESALVRAYRRAYKSVDHPVEGTILTVAREGIEGIRGRRTRGQYVNDVFSLYLSKMREVYPTLPTLLPILEQAGVNDSGALGYIAIVEGMVKALYEEEIPLISGEEKIALSLPTSTDKKFDRHSEFTLGYCQEFLLQLLDSHTRIHPFNIKNFTTALRQLGESLIVISEGDIVKVHIHTMTPDKVMAEAQRYGEFISFKLDNLDFQNAHLEHEEAVKMLHGEQFVHNGEHLAVIVSGGGEGASQLLIDNGATIAIVKEGGVSIEEYLRAFEEAKTPHIVLLPGNSNDIGSAELAKKQYQDAEVTIVPTSNVLESYYALVYGTSDIVDEEERIKAMEEGSKMVLTASIAKASKDYSSDDVTLEKGDFAGILGKLPVAGGSDIHECLKALLSAIPEIKDKESVFLLSGKNAIIDEEKLSSVFDSFPWLSYEVYEGGQEQSEIIVGLL